MLVSLQSNEVISWRGNNLLEPEIEIEIYMSLLVRNYTSWDLSIRYEKWDR